MTSWWQTPIDGETPEEYLKTHGEITNDGQMAAVLSEFTGMDISVAAVRQKRQALGINKPKCGVRFIQSTRPKRNKPLIIHTDNALVITDIHAELQDAEWLERVVDFAVAHGIKICVVGGDLIDLDALSSFTPAIGSVGETPATTDGELGAASAIIATLLMVFDEVYILLGNHEERLARKLGNLTIQFIGKLLGADGNRAIVSEYHWCIIEDANGKQWRITHPRDASGISVRVAARLADKYRMNVVAAHGHDWGCVVSPSGYYAAASGMMADPERIDYTTLVDNVRPFMSQGAWALVDGEPVLLHPEWAKPERL